MHIYIECEVRVKREPRGGRPASLRLFIATLFGHAHISLFGSLSVVAPFAKFVPKLARTCTKGQLSSFYDLCVRVCECAWGKGIFLYAGQRRKIIIPDMANWTSERALCARHQRRISPINRRLKTPWEWEPGSGNAMNSWRKFGLNLMQELKTGIIKCHLALPVSKIPVI